MNTHRFSEFPDKDRSCLTDAVSFSLTRCLCQAYDALYNRLVERLREGMGGLNHVEREASFEAKKSGVRGAVVGGRRVVVVAGERGIRGNRVARAGYPDVEHRSEPRNNFR